MQFAILALGAYRAHSRLDALSSDADAPLIDTRVKRQSQEGEREIWNDAPQERKRLAILVIGPYRSTLAPIAAKRTSDVTIRSAAFKGAEQALREWRVCRKQQLEILVGTENAERPEA